MNVNVMKPYWLLLFAVIVVLLYVIAKKGNLKNAINYITRADKTDLNLIYCKDCKLNTIIEEFNYVKNIYIL